MCSNKKPRVGEANCNKAKLEVTCHPEETTFRDEGGRFNYLFVCVILRTGSNGLPLGLGAKKKVPLQCTLEYEDGTEIHSFDSKPSLRLFGNIELGMTPKEGRPSLDCQTLCGSVRYKIQKLSRNHDARRFRVRIALEGISESVVQSAVTRPTMVLSKRKWLKAEDRSPEMDKRNHVEELASADNIELGKLAATTKAQTNFDIDIRALAESQPLEKHYPEPSTLQSSDAISCRLSADGSNSSGSIDDPIGENESFFSFDDIKDSDEEYKPGSSSRSSKRSIARSKRTRKSDSNTSASSSATEKMFTLLMSRLDSFKNELSEISTSMKRLEKEHEEMKRKIQASENSLAKRKKSDDDALRVMESQEAKPTENSFQESFVLPLQPSNVVRSTSQISLPFSLPRMHSLGLGVGEESFSETFSTLFQ